MFNLFTIKTITIRITTHNCKKEYTLPKSDNYSAKMVKFINETITENEQLGVKQSSTYELIVEYDNGLRNVQSFTDEIVGILGDIIKTYDAPINEKLHLEQHTGKGKLVGVTPIGKIAKKATVLSFAEEAEEFESIDKMLLVQHSNNDIRFSDAGFVEFNKLGKLVIRFNETANADLVKIVSKLTTKISEGLSENKRYKYSFDLRLQISDGKLQNIIVYLFNVHSSKIITHKYNSILFEVPKKQAFIDLFKLFTGNIDFNKQSLSFEIDELHMLPSDLGISSIKPEDAKTASNLIASSGIHNINGLIHGLNLLGNVYYCINDGTAILDADRKATTKFKDVYYAKCEDELDKTEFERIYSILHVNSTSETVSMLQESVPDCFIPICSINKFGFPVNKVGVFTDYELSKLLPDANSVNNYKAKVNQITISELDKQLMNFIKYQILTINGIRESKVLEQYSYVISMKQTNQGLVVKYTRY